MGRFTGVLGLLTMLALAYLFSTNRRAIKLKMVIWGLSLQIAFAFLVFYWTFGQMLFYRAGDAVNKLLDYAFAGSEFVFGELGKQHSSIGFVFAFQVLPAIIFIASLFALLYYLGVMQVVIRAAAWAMQRVMGASGAESLNVAASIFMGQTEAPLDDPAVSAGLNAIRVDDHHDQRHGARFGRDHGGLYRVRSGSAAPADCGDHDRAGNTAHFQNAGARRRSSRKPWAS